jgi:hypothetical protein
MNFVSGIARELREDENEETIFQIKWEDGDESEYNLAELESG